MKRLAGLAFALPFGIGLGGCTSYLVQQEGKPWPGHYADCPSVYTSTRLELSSIAWAFAGDPAPPDSCLNRYYPKAAKDPFYQSMNQWMTPLYVLSLPADLVLDTITLPLAASGAWSE